MAFFTPIVEEPRSSRRSPERFPFTPPPDLPPSFDRLALQDNMSEGQQDPNESLTPEEASRIIHSHRKVRYGKPGAPQCR
jgi:hypothetical protein